MFVLRKLNNDEARKPSGRHLHKIYLKYRILNRERDSNQEAVYVCTRHWKGK